MARSGREIQRNRLNKCADLPLFPLRGIVLDEVEQSVNDRDCRVVDGILLNMQTIWVKDNAWYYSQISSCVWQYHCISVVRITAATRAEREIGSRKVSCTTHIRSDSNLHVSQVIKVFMLCHHGLDLVDGQAALLRKCLGITAQRRKVNWLGTFLRHASPSGRVRLEGHGHKNSLIEWRETKEGMKVKQRINLWR